MWLIIMGLRNLLELTNQLPNIYPLPYPHVQMLLKSPLTSSGPLSSYSVSMNNNFVALIYMSQPERRGDLPTGEKVSPQESILNFRQID